MNQISATQFYISYYSSHLFVNQDGTLITTLDRRDSASDSEFGNSVAITDDKVLVGAEHDDDLGYRSGSVFIYSAIDGEFIEKAVAPDGKGWDYFSWSVSASRPHHAVGAFGVDDKGDKSGAGYLLKHSSLLFIVL